MCRFDGVNLCSELNPIALLVEVIAGMAESQAECAFGGGEGLQERKSLGLRGCHNNASNPFREPKVMIYAWLKSSKLKITHTYIQYKSLKLRIFRH